MNLNLRLCDLHRVFPMGMAAGINLRGDLHGSGRHHFLIICRSLWVSMSRETHNRQVHQPLSI